MLVNSHATVTSYSYIQLLLTVSHLCTTLDGLAVPLYMMLDLRRLTDCEAPNADRSAGNALPDTGRKEDRPDLSATS